MKPVKQIEEEKKQEKTVRIQDQEGEVDQENDVHMDSDDNEMSLLAFGEIIE